MGDGVLIYFGYPHAHEDDVERARAALADAAAAGSVRSGLELRLRHSDGSWLQTETVVNPRLDDEDVGGLVLTTRDVTTRKQLEAVQAEPMLAGRVLGFSGRHASAPTHVPADTTVHLFHGMADSVIPAAAAIDSAQTLLALGADVTADVLPGIAHELHPALMDKAIEQLRGFVPKKLLRQAMSEAPVLSRVASSDELGPPRSRD